MQKQSRKIFFGKCINLLLRKPFQLEIKANGADNQVKNSSCHGSRFVPQVNSKITSIRKAKQQVIRKAGLYLEQCQTSMIGLFLRK